MVGRKGNKVSRGNICRLHLVRDVAKPVISIQWLIRVAEHSGVEAGEIMQRYCDRLLIVPMIVLLRKLSHDPFYELTVQLELLHHASHIVWRRWRIIGTTATTTKSNHPAKM